MKIKLCLKREFGNARYYPVEPKAVLLAKLINRKSLTVAQLKLVKKIGIEIEVDDSEVLPDLEEE